MPPPSVALARALTLASFAVTLAWTGQYRGGVGSAGKPRFNWHPVLLSLALVLLAPNAALTVRRAGHARAVGKPAHAYANLAALVLAAGGLYSVFAFHAEFDIPDLCARLRDDRARRDAS